MTDTMTDTLQIFDKYDELNLHQISNILNKEQRREFAIQAYNNPEIDTVYRVWISKNDFVEYEDFEEVPHIIPEFNNFEVGIKDIEVLFFKRTRPYMPNVPEMEWRRIPPKERGPLKKHKNRVWGLYHNDRMILWQSFPCLFSQINELVLAGIDIGKQRMVNHNDRF